MSKIQVTTCLHGLDQRLYRCLVCQPPMPLADQRDAFIADLRRQLMHLDCNLSEVTSEYERYRRALEQIAAPKRPDGTYNRCREACELLARQALRLDA